MSMQVEPFSEILEIAKRNGDFRRNYGTIIGAFLYLRSIRAVKGKSSFWTGLLFAGFSAGLAWDREAELVATSIVPRTPQYPSFALGKYPAQRTWGL